MAEKSAPKSKSDDLKDKLILQFGTANNFDSWRLYQIDRCSIEFDFQANILKNNVIYVPCDRAGVRGWKRLEREGARSVLIGNVVVVRLLMSCARGVKE